MVQIISTAIPESRGHNAPMNDGGRVTCPWPRRELGRSAYISRRGRLWLRGNTLTSGQFALTHSLACKMKQNWIHLLCDSLCCRFLLLCVCKHTLLINELFRHLFTRTPDPRTSWKKWAGPLVMMQFTGHLYLRTLKQPKEVAKPLPQVYKRGSRSWCTGSTR